MAGTRGRASPTHVSGKPFLDVGNGPIPCRPEVRDGTYVSYTVYFRDSEECLHSLSHLAASESEALDWFTRIGITVVAIRPSTQLR
jgi:hypothetical protein